MESEQDGEIVITGRGIKAKAVHKPSEEDPTQPACKTFRKGKREWRRVEWEVVAPTHRRCKYCFPDATD